MREIAQHASHRQLRLVEFPVRVGIVNFHNYDLANYNIG
jgi:hypothetical protein